ncbi:MAG: PQQ-binding-like beta-propeller repeat protein, partial [Lentisphaeria bacterium]|nr:PQQ-binding-like beta-propeller repeat protein [Lentisphaeria bacterium]
RKRLKALQDTHPALAEESAARLEVLDAFGTLLLGALADLARGEDKLPTAFAEATNTLRDIAEWTDRHAGWTTYGGDNTRSFLSHERLPAQLAVLWRHQPTAPPAPAWPPPATVNYNVKQLLSPTLTYDRAHHAVVMNDRVVYGSSSSDAVVCLAAADGRELWRFTTEGPVRLPPAIANGRVYAGADDGRLYCIDLATGSKIWQYEAGDAARLVGNGRIISEQPVRAGICVDQGTVYFTAGIFPKLGVRLCAVDARSGQEVWEKNISYAAQGFMLLSPDRIFVPTGRTPFVMFQRTDGTRIGSLGRSNSWGKSLPGGTCAVVVNETVITGPGEGGNLFGFNTEKSEMVVRTQGRRLIVDGLTTYILGKDRLSAHSRKEYIAGKSTRDIWATPCPSSFSMLKCSNRILVGATDEILIFDAAKGKILQRLALTGGRVEGLAMNRGRVFASLGDGGIICLGAGPARKGTQAASPEHREPANASALVDSHAAALANWCEVRKGWMLLLGDDIPDDLAPALARSSQCHIVIAADSAPAAVLRKRYAGAGLLGARISVHAT